MDVLSPLELSASPENDKTFTPQTMVKASALRLAYIIACLPENADNSKLIL